MPLEMVTIGRILAPFGRYGEVKVLPYSDRLERCHLLRRVKIEGVAHCGFKDVQRARIHKRIWLLQFTDCQTREEAGRLKNALVKIDGSERLPLPEGSYYFDQILGLDVYTAEGRFLGRVREILQPGGNDVYRVVKDSPRSEVLIPALQQVVTEVNLAEGKMIIRPLPGLLDEEQE